MVADSLTHCPFCGSENLSVEILGWATIDRDSGKLTAEPGEDLTPTGRAVCNDCGQGVKSSAAEIAQ
jgi:transcription elongation factor Elf1